MLGFKLSGLLLLQLAALLASPASAELVDMKKVCVSSLIALFGKLKWAGAGYPSYYGMLCKNPNAVVSMYAAISTYCTAEEAEIGEKMWSSYCTEYGHATLKTTTEMAANLTPAAIAALPVYARSDLNITANRTAPFMPNKAWFLTYRNTVGNWDYEENQHALFSYAIYGFWGPILIFGMIQHAVRRVVEKRRGYVYADAEGNITRGTSTPDLFRPLVSGYAWLRKYFITPSALPPYHQNRILGSTIPTRVESFVVLSFWILNIVLGFANYRASDNNQYYPKKSTQIWRYLADRTGIMSYANLPLLWMFSGRNNIFLWMTGWSFATFNMYHRHIARIATLQGIMHSIGYTAFYFDEGYGSSYREEYKERWFYLGVAATVVMSFTIILSFSLFRNRTYEFFLIMHIVLSVLLIVFLYYHTAIFTLSEYNYPFLLTPVAIWAFDRVMRFVRQIWCNLYVSRNRGKGLLWTKTTVSFDDATNMLIIDCVPGNAHIFPGPGQHYYIYQPFRFFGWENHPFTLNHWTTDSTTGELHLIFGVRPYDGWTKKLVKQCVAKGGPTRTVSTPMILEGPYGEAGPLHCFEEVLLVAGGSGIAGVLPYLTDYVRRVEEGAAAAQNGGRIPTRTRHVTLVWTDRREEYIEYVAHTQLGPIVDRDDVSLCFYNSTAQANHNISTASSSTEHVDSPTLEKTAFELTGDKGCATSDSGVLSSPVSPSSVKPCRKQLSIRAGRPDVLSTVRKLAAAIDGTEQRLAVMMCGPAKLADDLRVVLAECMSKNRENIEYFEESFGW